MEYFPGFTTLELVRGVQESLVRLEETSVNFTAGVTFDVISADSNPQKTSKLSEWYRSGKLDESKEMIREVGNMELCELLDMEHKAQCQVCLSFWTSASSSARAGTSCKTEHVKSRPPTTENWLRKLYTYTKKNNMSTEDKHETNHINNKYNDTNTDTRKMHNT